MTANETQATVRGEQVLGPPRLLVDTAAPRRARDPFVAELRAALTAAGRDFTVTTASGDVLAAAAREALAAGERYLVAVGDDTSVGAVLQGMIADGVVVAPDAVLGLAEVGEPCDTARTYGLDRPAEVLAPHLLTDRAMKVDVGLVRYRAGGEPATRAFLNIAQAGYGADLVRRQTRLRRLGRLGNLLAAYGAIRAVPPQQVEVTLDHAATKAGLVNLVVANGQFYAGGSKVAPRGLPDDGRFNVQLFSGERSQVFLLTTPIFRGEHLPDPAISEYQSATVRLAPDTPVPVEADGAPLGTTPAEFSVLPAALWVKL